MQHLGSFLLLALHSKPEFRGESLQRGAELLGEGKDKENVNEKEKEKEKMKWKEKERRREKGASDKEKYRFKDSGNGKSWLIGDDTERFANAYVNYLNGCEETLKIPHELTDESGNTKYVEVIGQHAFCYCGDKDSNGRTRSIILSRYIKVIKIAGLGSMHDVTSFEIEEGSCLESIEYKGFDGIGFSIRSESERSGILVLPSTVTSITADGLYWNNMFKSIYYCGSTHLSNSSDLVNGVNEPDIKVTSSYKYDTIFGSYGPNKDEVSIVENICNKYKPKPSPSRSISPSPSRSVSPSPSRSVSPSPSRSISPSPSRSISPSPSRSISPSPSRSISPSPSRSVSPSPSRSISPSPSRSVSPSPSRSVSPSPSRSVSPSPSRSVSPSPSRSVSPSPSRSISPSPSCSPTASFLPTAGYQGRGWLLSLLNRLSRSGRSGIGSLRHGELRTAEAYPVKSE